MSGHNLKFKAYTPTQQTGKPPVCCSKCYKPFDPETWPKSKWTLNGYSPWCPLHHADFAQENPFAFNNRRSKPGPKPKPKPPGAPKGEKRGAARYQASKVQCVNGHPFDELNTYRTKTGRACRACRRESVRKAKAKAKGART